MFRIQHRERNERGRLSYISRLLLFFFRSAVFLSWRHLRNPYQLIHVHSVPDFEVFAALLPKLMGCKVILDIHDIVPEFYASKFQVGRTFLSVQSAPDYGANGCKVCRSRDRCQSHLEGNPPLAVRYRRKVHGSFELAGPDNFFPSGEDSDRQSLDHALSRNP